MNRIILIFFLAMPSLLYAQSNNWHYSLEADAINTPSDKLPFWLRADQYGGVPLTGASGSFLGTIRKDYDPLKTGKLDWTAGLELRTNFSNRISYLTLIEGFIAARKGIFQLKVGRSKDIIGLVDSTLSTGSFATAGNALGIPKVELSIPNYYSFLNKLLAIKGGYAFGYVGDQELLPPSLVSHTTTYYQQGQLYGRFGKPNWRLNIFAGINHEVYYGGEKSIYGSSVFTLSPIQDFLYAATGKTYNPPNLTNTRGSKSKVGNSIGSVDLGLQYEFSTVRLMLYRQNIYDVGALFHLANIADGINGLSLTNKINTSQLLNWHKILFEFVYTANQAGYFNSIYVKSGDEDYYNNSIYKQGWTYDGLNLGNPLIATRQYVRKGLATNPSDYFIDNRVEAFQTGFEGSVHNYNIVLKLTYSENYGTFGTSPEGHSKGETHYPPTYGLFGEVNQFSGYLELNKSFAKGYNIGLAIASDNGDLYYNSIGVLLKLKKSFR